MKQEAINHYKHGISHDIFSEPVTTYARLSIEALGKQIPKKPTHIYEEYPEHLWALDINGEIDTCAWDAGFHNGVFCTRCYHTECEHCNPKWQTHPEEPCVIDEYACSTCGFEVVNKYKHCPNCGQALDWSE